MAKLTGISVFFSAAFELMIGAMALRYWLAHLFPRRV